MTKRAEFSDSNQASVLERLWRQSGRDQTTAAAAGPMSGSAFWRIIKGRQPLREDQYPAMARALAVTERDLRRALAGDDDAAPVNQRQRRAATAMGTVLAPETAPRAKIGTRKRG